MQNVMKKEFGLETNLPELKSLAKSLLYMEPEDLSGLDKLDLRHISELKRSGNGGVEIKFASRLELLQLLTILLESDAGSAESFVSALSSAAAALGEKDEDN